MVGACTTKKQVAATPPPPAPPPLAAAPAPQPPGIMPGSVQDFKVNVGDTVHFAYNEYNIQDSDKATLQKQATWLNNIRRSRSPSKAIATSAAPANTIWRWARAEPIR